MILDCSKYVGPCKCGRTHTLETEKVVVEYGATANFEQYMADVGLADKRRVVVYDSNIYELTQGKHVKADQEIVLPAQGLRSEDIIIEKMMEDLDNPEVIVAYGAGTIMDFGRYPAFELGIPFVAIPTLASSDGFTANICSVIIDGQKKSIPMKAPTLVVADLDIIKGAPKRLVVSGVNDILSKYISLTDWRIANLVDDEYFCPMVADLAEHALSIMRTAAHSRAASGAEHLMAHLVEMQPPRFEGAEGIHGECVGVGTFLCCQEYHKLATMTPEAVPFEPLSEEWIREKFGDRLAPGIIKENEEDVLGTFDPQNIVDHWPEIVDLINKIPSVEELEGLYKAIGSKYLPEHIGIDPALRDEMLPISAAIRNRLTLVRMMRVLKFPE